MSATQRARDAYNAAVEQRDAAIQALEAVNDETAADDADAFVSAAEQAQEAVERCKKELDRVERVMEARSATPLLDSTTSTASESEGIEVRFHAQPKGSQKFERTYRPDNSNGSFFLRDLAAASMKGDTEARERLHRNNAEARDISTSATAGGGFVPPLYMGEMWAGAPTPNRAFANAIGSRPLPATGMSITLPRITTQPATAAQSSENNALTETNLVEATVTTPVCTYGGIQDVSVQLLERSDPGIDLVIASELRANYDSKIDAALLSGAGSSGAHRGLANVSAINYVTFTEATPSAANTQAQIYAAISAVASNRYAQPDLIVMHPRRAAFLAQSLSSNVPLFQQGGLSQAQGTQDGGFVSTLAGLRVVLDANITTTYGSSTNEDQIFVVKSDDLVLFEDAVRFEAFPETLSAELTVRLRLFAFSAFVSGRYPKSIAQVYGTGLAAPTFAG